MLLGEEYDCRFSDRVAAVLSQLQIEGMSKYKPGWWYGEKMADDRLNYPRFHGDLATMGAGRPNMTLSFQQENRVHLSVLYYNPLCFRFKDDGSDQYTFDQAITHERLEKNPFCLFLKPKPVE